MFSAKGSVIEYTASESKGLSLQEAIRLQAKLAQAIHEVMDQKVRTAEGLLITPDDAAWQATIAELNLESQATEASVLDVNTQKR